MNFAVENLLIFILQLFHTDGGGKEISMPQVATELRGISAPLLQLWPLFASRRLKQWVITDSTGWAQGLRCRKRRALLVKRRRSAQAWEIGCEFKENQWERGVELEPVISLYPSIHPSIHPSCLPSETSAALALGPLNSCFSRSMLLMSVLI